MSKDWLMSFDKKAKKQISQFFYKHKSLNKTVVIVRKNIEDIYGEKIRQNQNYNYLKTMQGAYLPKDDIVIILLNNHKNIKDIQTTLKHEIYGHHATYRLKKYQKKELLNSIIDLKNDKELKSYWDKVDKYYDGINETQKAEEVFCLIVQESQIGIKETRAIKSYKAQSLDEIKNIAYDIQNKYINKELKQEIIPKDNSAQFKKLRQTKNQKLYNGI